MDCGLFVIGYAMAKLRGLPLQVFDQANMPAMREALAEDLLGLGMVLMLVCVCQILHWTTVVVLRDRHQDHSEGVYSWSPHSVVIPVFSHAIRSAPKVICLLNLLSKVQCSQRSCRVIMINGLRVLFRLIARPECINSIHCKQAVCKSS